MLKHMTFSIPISLMFCMDIVQKCFFMDIFAGGYLWNRLIDATNLKYVDTELFNFGYRCYFSRFRQYW